MCAIAGMIGLDCDSKTAHRMLQTMAHRGPDGKGSYCWEDTVLHHARLAIIDPQGGRQPMQLTWAGESYVSVYNGELYNTGEIRSDLIK